jgi:riboflavin synthase
MFTGIVSEIGTVRSVEALTGGVELGIEAPETVRRLTVGASVSVNGVCQTVVRLSGSMFRIQAVGTTIEKTTLGRLVAGGRVNLEASLRAGDEIGGHLVTGHVDCTARIAQLDRRGDALMLSVQAPREILRFVAPRGSIAIDGISLTVADVRGSWITISVIPHTRDHTIVRDYRIGDEVNVEADLLARYVDRLLEQRAPGSRSDLTLESLTGRFS